MQQLSALRPFARWQVLRRKAVAASALFLVGCDFPESQISGTQPAPPNVRHYLSGSAAASLNGEGLFALDAPAAPGSRTIISAARAGELALASVRTWGPSLRGAWERQSGRAIELHNLTLGPRIFFARTPYGAFPEGYHPAFPRLFGPYYLVTLHSGADPVLLIAVSAYSTEATIDHKGLVHRPPHKGAEFISMGLPVDTSSFRLTSPEEAVEQVGRATRSRIAATPELVRGGMPQSPAAAMWKLSLDREISVRSRGKGTLHRVRHLYVGPDRGQRMLMAVPSPVASVRVGAVTIQGGDAVQHVDVPVLDGEVLSFEAVDVQPEGSQ